MLRFSFVIIRLARSTRVSARQPRMHNPNNDHKIETSTLAAAADRVLLIDSLLSYSLGNLAVLPFDISSSAEIE